jgi:aspartate/methionine/tyrosine aminotransferase
MALKVGRGASAPPFMVMDVIAQANARQLALSVAPNAPFRRVIRMEVGQPGTGAPAGARAAVTESLSAGAPMGYTEAFGLPALRARIARHIQDWYGVSVPMERIAVTFGASGAFPLAFLAAFDRGDRVALAAPFYPPYVNILTALGMQPVILPAGPQTRFQPTVAMLAALDPKPDGVIVASPCNPAGTMLHPDELAAIATWCHSNGVRLISDEIYHGLHYDSPLATATAFSESAVVINSFSKYFSMTGWRVGWMVLPEDLRRPVECLAQNMFISAPHISQIAALAAFDCGDELDGNVARYRRSRSVLLDALPRAGLHRLSPAEGAFYLYAEIDEDSQAFCARLLDEMAIAVTPGLDFDRDRGEHFVRFSYCGPEDEMAEAAERLLRLPALRFLF